MSRGISDPIQPPVEQSEEVSNEELLAFIDEVAMMVRDINTRLLTLERNLLAPHAPHAPHVPEEKTKKKFLNGK
jgi:hypothetical protein